MKVFLNNVEHEVSTETTISRFLQEIKMKNLKGTALAVNGEIVPADQWQHTLIKDQDQVLMIEAVQGG
jgi:sulfur carrier protein